MKLVSLEYSEKLEILPLLILLGLLGISLVIALSLLNLPVDPMPEIMSIRLPHVLLVVLVGASLSLCGALMQSLFCHPLADPYLAGTSSSAAVFVWLINAWPICSEYSLLTLFGPQLAAALATAGVAYVLYKAAQLRGRTMVVGMMLLGLGVNTGFWSLLVCLDLLTPKLLLDNRELLLWGQFSNANWFYVVCAASVLCIIGIIATWLIPSLKTLRLGPGTARQLGVNIKHVRWAVLACVSLAMTSIAYVGSMGLISLWAPNMARMLMGHNTHRYMLPASALLGATCLLWLDMLSHASVLGCPLPVGLLSTLLGVPFLIAIVWRERFYIGV